MREPTFLTIVALASILVAPPFSAFAQRERGPPRLEGRRLQAPIPVRPQTVRPVYRGQLAGGSGGGHQAERKGRLGGGWDVGGYWSFYGEQTEGPPHYVSDVEIAVADDPTAAPPPPPPPPQPKHAFYYHPGDIKGVPYDTIEECTKARERAGDVGVCVYK